MMKRLLSFALLILIAGSLSAADAPAVERGFAADKVYQLGDLDSVNIFNGNVSITIPIGQSYPVDGGLGYSLQLSYNSKVWDFVQSKDFHHYTTTAPSRVSNAGMGWILTMGTLIPPASPLAKDYSWIYVSPDGGEHGFLSTQKCPNPSAPCTDPQTVAYGYTGDGSYLRLRERVGGQVLVEMPNGMVQEFLEVPGSKKHAYRLVRMHDSLLDASGNYVNVVSVDYNSTPPAECVAPALTMHISDKHSTSSVRNHWICYKDLDYPDSYMDGMVVDKVVLDGFPQPDGSAHSVYQFHYGDPTHPVTQVGRSCGENNPYVSDTVMVPFLTSMQLPDGTWYRMSYFTGGAVGDTPSAECRGGSIADMTLPTLGRIVWKYQDYHIPIDSCNQRAWLNLSSGVYSRQYTDADGNNIGTWTYHTEEVGNTTQRRCDGDSLPIHFGQQPPEELKNTLESPTGERTVHHFSVWPLSDPAVPDRGFVQGEYGLPFTRLESDATDPIGSFTRYLSTETFGANQSTPSRKTYVAYQGIASSCLTIDAGCLETNRRLVSTRTVFPGDGNRSTYTDKLRYDGFGNFRQTNTGGNFQPDTPPLVSTTTFNPSIPDASDPGFHTLDLRAPWILGTYASQSISDGSRTFNRQFCFDPSSGILRRTRVLAGASPGPTDILTLNDTDVAGNVVTEHIYGGDRRPLSDNGADLCSITPSGEEFRLVSTYQYGVKATQSYWDVDAGSVMGFHLVRNEIDPHTGRIKTSYDSADAATTYSYDLSGRLVGQTAPGTTPATYVYTPATAGAPPRAEQIIGSGEATIQHRIFEYDGRGRLVVEKELMPDGSWSGRKTSFDGSGRKTSVTEPVALDANDNVPADAAAIHYGDYDAVGRARQIESADHKITSYAYTGDRLANVTHTVATALDAATPVTITEERDSFSHLIKITEPAGATSKDSPVGAPVVTAYQYDPAGHLIHVGMTDGQTTQSRTFTYDGRGFLMSEQTPELGATGNGTASYSFDPRGHLLTRILGANDGRLDAAFEYDRAERLRDIFGLAADGSRTTIKHFDFATANAPGDLANGKTRSAVRHNKIPNVGDVAVTDTFTYGGPGGRLSSKQTAVTRDGSPMQTFTQSYTYTGVGDLASLAYPDCASCSNAPSGFEVTTLYRNGRIAGVQGYADRLDEQNRQAGIAYWPNGVLREIHHTTRDGNNDQVDLITPDPTGRARAGQIDFAGYCVGPPVVTGEPADKSSASGQTVSLSVTPPPNVTATYAWHQVVDGVDSLIPSSNSASITSPILTKTTGFYVMVTASGCPTRSRTAIVTVRSCTGVSITTQPHDVYIAGSSATFTVVASDPAAHYQWYQRDGMTDTAVGSDSPTLTLSPISSPASFFVRVSSPDHVCVVDSRLVQAKVCQGVSITLQPEAEQVVPTGSTVRVNAAASGPLPLTFTWTNSADPMHPIVHSSPDGSDTLELAGFDSASPQTWSVRASSDCGSGATSNSFTIRSVTCADVHFFATPSGGLIAQAGQGMFAAVQMEPQESDTQHYAYAWYANNNPNPFATTAETQITSSTPWSSFYIKVTDLSCPSHPVLVSPKFYVWVYASCPIGSVSVTPPSASVVRGGSATLSAVTDFPVGITWQWYRGASGDTRVPLTSVAGHPNQVVADYHPNLYWVRMTNDCGVYRDSATVPVGISDDGGSYVCDPVRILTQPQGGKVAAGASLALGVDATANPDVLGYQWSAGSQPIAGAYGSSYTATPTQSTLYSVTVTSSCNALAKSLPALVQVTSCGTNHVTAQPASALVTSGTGTTLAVTVSDPSDVVSYQWYQGTLPDTSTPVGSSATSFTTPLLTAPASYWVRMTTSSGCTFDSDTAVLDVCVPAAVKNNYTRDQHIVPGQYVWIGIAADGTHVAYDWFLGSSNSDTSHPLNQHTPLIQVHPSTTSSYWVRVTNECATDKSDVIQVSICPPMGQTPTAAKSPVMPGTTTTLTIAASGTDLHYQWYQGESGDASTPIANSDHATITTPVIHGDTTFWVMLRSGGCTTPSEPVTVLACAEPGVAWLPSNLTQIRQGQLTQLSIQVAPVVDTQLTYYSGSTAGDVAHSTLLSGPTINQAIFVTPTATTSYWVRASEPNGCYADTNALTVSVCVPTITTQPQSTTVNSGAATTLTVAATGEGLSYHWYQGSGFSTPIGTNSPTLTVSPTATTSYHVQVTGCASVDSNLVTLSVCQPPTATSSYTSYQIVSGNSTTIGVNVGGSPTPAIQWYQGASGNTTTPLAGKTATTLVVNPTATTQYWARASNQCAAADGPTVNVDVCTAPVITTQPASVPVAYNGTATLTVAASTSAGTVSYQWYRGVSGDTSAPVGSNSSSFTTPAVTVDTQYWVRVVRGACFTDSSEATVFACQLVAYVANMQSKSAQSVTLTASVSGARNTLSYTWYRGNAGDTSTPLNLVSQSIAVAPSTTRNYWVLVSDGTCTVNSNTATVSICIPNITASPASILINAGQSTMLSVTATGENLSYQWYIGAAGVTTTPVGTNSSSLTVTPAATTTYWVRVTGCQFANSTAATVTICALPSITSGPGNTTINRNAQATLGVNTSGTGLGYQWYRGNAGDTSQPIGTNSNLYTATYTQTTKLWVKVTGTCGNVNSTTGTVSVYPTVNAQPADAHVTRGTGATFSVSTDATTIAYQWYQGTAGDTSHPASGATAATFTTTPLTVDTQYFVRLTSGSAAIDSDTVTAYVCPSPTVNVSNPTQTSGAYATLSIASPSGNDAYKWYRGNSGDTSTLIADTGASTSISVNPTQTTNYWARATNSLCAADSATVTVAVCTPAITSQPQNAGITQGQTTRLSVAATGTPALTYQWYSGTTGSPVAIGGATGTYVDVTPSSTTTYFVRVTSAAGCYVNSSVITVTVCQLPVITAINGGGSAQPGYTTAVSVTATGTSLSYQWYAGLAGDTSHPVFTNTRNPSFNASQTSYYWVRLSNSCGSVNSTAVLNSVYPQIYSQPQSIAISSGTHTTLTVAASGVSLTYQWYANDYSHPVAGATSPTFTTPNLTVETSYMCGVTSGNATTVSQYATVSMCVGPLIDYPWSSHVSSCWNVGVQVNSQDIGNVNYYWYQGATGDTSHPIGPGNYYAYVCPTVTTSYWCRVSFADGSCSSDSSTITVH